jgi:hypothetical protein
MKITMGEDLPDTKKKPAPVINLITAEDQRAAREAAEEAAEEAAAKAAAQAENAQNEEGNE